MNSDDREAMESNGERRDEASTDVIPIDESASDPTKVHVPTSTRAGRAWVLLVLGVIFLGVLLAFIFENLQKTKVSFLGASARVPLALALLIATILGSAIVLLVGSIRIIQLRRAVRRRTPHKWARRHPRLDNNAATASEQPADRAESPNIT